MRMCVKSVCVRVMHYVCVFVCVWCICVCVCGVHVCVVYMCMWICVFVPNFYI